MKQPVLSREGKTIESLLDANRTKYGLSVTRTAAAIFAPLLVALPAQAHAVNVDTRILKEIRAASYVHHSGATIVASKFSKGKPLKSRWAKFAKSKTFATAYAGCSLDLDMSAGY